MLRIRTENALQYILLYLMLVSHGSGLLLAIGSRWPYIYILISLFIIVWHGRADHQRIFAYVCILCACLMVTRYVAGGVGIDIMVTIVARVLIAYSAVIQNRKKCAENYVKLSGILCCFSVVFFVLLNANRKSLTLLLPFQANAGNNVIFCFNPVFTNNLLGGADFVMRNNGMYTEPTLMAIQVLTTLFILITMRSDLHFDDKVWKRYIAIMVVTLLTTLSTTGYITLMVSIVILVLAGEFSKKFKVSTCLVTIAILTVAYLEYRVNGDRGLIGYFFLRKTMSVSSTGQMVLDLGAAGTGNARISVILASLALLPRYPLGCGYNIFSNYILNYSLMGQASSGGGFMTELAVFGIIPFVTTMLFYYKGVMRATSDRVFTAIFFVILIITTTAESTTYYSAFIMIAVLGYHCPIQREAIGDTL